MLEGTSKKIINLTLIAAALGGIFFIFHSYNPSQSSFFLPCPFKYATGYHCPGCGSQRAIHQLAKGNITHAFGLNPLMVLSLPIIVYAFGLKLYNYLFSTQLRVTLFYSNLFIVSYFSIVVVYWIARNIPTFPFTLLAPTD